MLLDRRIRIDLFQNVDAFNIPYSEILNEWMQLNFSPESCKKSLERVISIRKLPEKWFRTKAIIEGEVAVSEEVLYPKVNSWTVRVIDFRENQQPKLAWSKEIADNEIELWSTLIRTAVSTNNIHIIREECLNIQDDTLLSFVGMPWVNRTNSSNSNLRISGLHRREHASLAICSNTTTIIIDPIHLSSAWTPQTQKPPINHGLGKIDAIAITHAHSDHWDLPSILHMTATDNSPVFIPNIPRTNILSPFSLERQLTKFGIESIIAHWGSTYTVGDFEIDVLPFYGEQPTRDISWCDPLIRNWGNCYRFNTPQFSALVLVDSGADPSGDILKAVADSVQRRGPVDIVLSCLRQFPCPFQGGLSSYWVPITFSKLRRLFVAYQDQLLPSVTSGPEGIAKVCAVSQARYFLPYAHGFSGLGQPVYDVGWGLGESSEAFLLNRLHYMLRYYGAKTTLVPWYPGDVASLSGSHLKLHQYQYRC